jgi:predicted nuclease of restriction endonuclease-like RecB superfamily/DNA-binding transcriptional regulator YhcF (GntR family)
VLPSELLAVWKRRGVIWPRYAKLSDDNSKVARELIEVYRDHVGKKKSVLNKLTGEIEDRGYDYRFIRGLSYLLDRRCRFKCNDTINAVDLRRTIYQKTAEAGLPTTLEHRKQIIEAVASELNVNAEKVEEFFYADLETELVLEEFKPLSPVELLQEYNLGLTQTLLFESTEVKFTSSGNWQRIFHSLKRLGLIYEASEDEGFWVKVDGPASLFKLIRRYGTSMAKLLPVIVANQQWTVEAKILWKYTNEMCNFKIESWKHNALLKKSEPPAQSFDSAVEEDFAARFQALKSGWTLRREPQPVLAGKQIIIPDFSLEREGIRVYVEIVGFWTLEYLLSKIDKLKKVDVDMLVLVDKNLACEKLADLEKHTKLNVIYYQDKISLGPILNHLERAFREVKTKQVILVKDLRAVFTEPVVSYGEFATRIGVSPEAVKVAFAEKPPEGYVVMSNGMVRKDVLEQIHKRMEEQMSQKRKFHLTEAIRTIEAEGVEDATGALETLGYKIIWHGINSEEAEVVKT